MEPLDHSFSLSRAPRRASLCAKGRRMFWRFAKSIGLFLGVALALLALLLVALQQPGRDSLAALPHGAGPATATKISHQALHKDGRLIQQYTIQDSVLGPIGLVVSLPDPLPDRPLPIVVVLGGLGSGLKNIRNVPPVGDNVVVGYDWPIPRKLPRGIDLFWQAPVLYDRVFRVPGQIAMVVEWVAGQPWAERDRISLLGFSLGAVAAPASQRLLEAQGLRVGWTVLAYGGANVANILEHHPKIRPDWARPLVGWLAERLFRPLDPAEHLPYLSGRFLLIGGTDDGLIPEHSAQLMRDLTPEPKTIVLLSGQHMGVGKAQTALFGQILEVTEDWLMDQGAVNPR